MFCSGCGRSLEQGQVICPQCNRPVAPAVPPVPGFEFVLASYASKIRVLGILWLVYAGITLIFGFAGLAFAHAFMSGGFGPWMHGHAPQMWFFPGLLRFAWVFLVGRAVSGSRGRLGSAGAHAVGADRRHRRRHPMPHSDSSWHSTGHRHTDHPDRGTELDALRRVVKTVD